MRKKRQTTLKEKVQSLEEDLQSLVKEVRNIKFAVYTLALVMSLQVPQIQFLLKLLA